MSDNSNTLKRHHWLSGKYKFIRNIFLLQHLSFSSLWVIFFLHIYSSLFFPMIWNSCPSVSIQWKCLQHSLHNISQGCEAINVSGVYVAQYSHDGNMLAVAVNQKSPADTSILYISTFTDTLLSSEMKGCGVNSPHTKRGKYVDFFFSPSVSPKQFTLLN